MQKRLKNTVLDNQPFYHFLKSAEKQQLEIKHN